MLDGVRPSINSHGVSVSVLVLVNEQQKSHFSFLDPRSAHMLSGFMTNLEPGISIAPNQSRASGHASGNRYLRSEHPCTRIRLPYWICNPAYATRTFFFICHPISPPTLSQNQISRSSLRSYLRTHIIQSAQTADLQRVSKPRFCKLASVEVGTRRRKLAAQAWGGRSKGTVCG